MKLMLLNVLLLLTVFVSKAEHPPIRLALITNFTNDDELAAISGLLKERMQTVAVLVELENLTAARLKTFTHVWYHRTDIVPLSSLERRAGALFRTFVKQGGNLFLSMESVPLLHEWGFEKIPTTLRTDTIRDEGFGRPLGFHAFKSHPVFSKLTGGAYVSKQPIDHIVRKHGFFDSAVPANGRVIGIDWTYITFTEQHKLLLEYNYGKGKVLAAGAYLYYKEANKNREHLGVFTENVLRYLQGVSFPDRAYYWNFDVPRFTRRSWSLPALSPAPAKNWNLPSPSLNMQTDSAGNSFYDLVGRRILWMGKLHAGMEELWLHPFMALRNFEAGIKLKSEDSVRWLRHVVPLVECSPEFLVRRYSIGTVKIKEVYAVSYDQPVGVAHYEIEEGDVDHLELRYSSNLRYMWPYSHLATGSINYGFDPNMNVHLITGQAEEISTLIWYSSKPLQQLQTVTDSLHQIDTKVLLPITASQPVNIAIAGGSEGLDAVVAQVEKSYANFNTIFEQSNNYYKKLLAEHVQLITPDTLFNAGYAWALARTDQFVQTTPGLGTALMAGFGTTARGWNGRHKISGRPGYAWYFGRDAQWSAMAINAYGDFAAVKEQLATFVRFQDLDGKVFHELTSSGVAHYDASDATPLFLVLSSHYLKYSGDTAYIRQIWPALEKAYQFCDGTDTDGDGLIENTNVGHGWIEGGALFGTHTEFYLAGCWAAALDAMHYMSHALNQPRATYADRSLRVKSIINTDFWNASKGYFYNGKYLDGTYMDQSTGFATVPMYLKAVIDKRKSAGVMRKITSSKFSTDWGIRMLEEDNPKYKAGSYHAGMVWPLYNGWGALGAYSNGMYKAGFQYIMNSLQVYQHWAPGSIEETLNGELYKPNGVCSHQCWSESMVVQPIIEGMLGFEPDALQNKMKIAPAFPWQWDTVTVNNLRMGNRVVSLRMQKSEAVTKYIFLSNGNTTVDFSPALPPLAKLKTVRWKGTDIPFSLTQDADGQRLLVQLVLNQGDGELIITTEGGIGALPVVTTAEINQRSKGLKILEEGEVAPKKYRLLVEGRPGMTYTFQMVSNLRVQKLAAAKLLTQEKNLLTLQVTIPEADSPYETQEIYINY